MRSIVIWAVAALAVAAQTTIRTYSYDGLGDRIRGPVVDVTGDSRTEKLQNINGRSVPLEQVEQRVVRSDGTTKVIERITKRFDPNGNLTGTDRVVEEQTKLAGGGSTVQATAYRSDVNGNMQPVERSVTETKQAGNVTTSESVIDRPALNGEFQTAEKQTVVTDQSPTHDVRNAVVYRRDENGRFYEALKETVDRQKSAGQTVENAAQYTVGTSGRLELASQTVRTAVKQPDGSESIVVDVYGQETPGLANSGETPRLTSQQVIDRKVRNGEVDEVVSLRQPSLADPNRLGPPRKIAETVCKGKCNP
jgi:hypothetical protein